MAETSSTLEQHVAAASSGDVEAFHLLVIQHESTRPEDLPNELKLLDARAVVDTFVASIAVAASFDDKISLLAYLQYICDINGPNANVDVVVAAGAVEQVVQQCLSSPAAKLQDAACTILISVLQMQRPQHVDALISAGSIPRLCQLLSTGKTSSIKESAAQLLWILEVAAPRSTLPALSAGKAAKHLTQLLASLDPGVLGPAAALLHELLTAYPTETLPLAAKAGVVRRLVVLLGTVDGDTRQAVFCCVADIAQDKQCSRALAAAGAVPKLVAVVADAGTPPEMLQSAAVTLAFLAEFGLMSQVRQAGAVQALVAALRRYDCGAIPAGAAGAAGAAAGAAALSSPAAVATAAATAAASSSPAPVAAAPAAAPASGLSNSTDHQRQGKNRHGSAAISCLGTLALIASAPGASQQQQTAALQAVVSAGGLRQMVRLISCAADPEVVLGAVYNTAGLLQRTAASVRPLVQAGAIEALAALLPGSQDSALPAEAALALSYIIKHCPEHLRQVGQAVYNIAEWDTLLSGMLSGRLSYPIMPGYAIPAAPASAVQEAGVRLLIAAACYAQQAGLPTEPAAQAACQALPALLQLLPNLPVLVPWLLRTALSELPQHLAAAVEAGAVPALLQVVQQWPMEAADASEAAASAAVVLQKLASLRSGADALVAAGGVQVLSAALQQHLQQGAAAAGPAGAAGLPRTSEQGDAADSLLRVLYCTALHEEHTAAVQPALQPLAPQLAQQLAQAQAGQQIETVPEVHGVLALVLALLQPLEKVLQAAGPGVVSSVAEAAPVLQEHQREQLASDVQAAQTAQAAADAIEAASAAEAAPGASDAPAAGAAAAGITCARCGARSGQGGARLQACGRCRAVSYCSKACQRSHWPQHKASCASV